MTKPRLLLTLLFMTAFLKPLPSNGACGDSFPQIKFCTKMKLISEKSHWGLAWRSRWPEFLKTCNVRLKDIETNKIWAAETLSCPNLPEEAYFHIDFSCNDTGWHPDSIRTWNTEECERSPEENWQRLQLAIEKIKTGDKITRLGEIGFRLEHWNLNAAYESSHFHSFPGVSLYVETETNCKRNDHKCRKDFDNHKIKAAPKRLVKYFLREDECTRWGGTPVPKNRGFQCNMPTVR